MWLVDCRIRQSEKLNHETKGKRNPQNKKVKRTRTETDMNQRLNHLYYRKSYVLEIIISNIIAREREESNM